MATFISASKGNLTKIKENFNGKNIKFRETANGSFKINFLFKLISTNSHCNVKKKKKILKLNLEDLNKIEVR